MYRRATSRGLDGRSLLTLYVDRWADEWVMRQRMGRVSQPGQVRSVQYDVMTQTDRQTASQASKQASKSSYQLCNSGIDYKGNHVLSSDRDRQTDCCAALVRPDAVGGCPHLIHNTGVPTPLRRHRIRACSVSKPKTRCIKVITAAAPGACTCDRPP
jgi:hypothetical protein